MSSTAEQPPTPPSKREVMLALLEHAEAQVHLDARRDGVELPAKLRASGNVRLDYGYALVPPIPDLKIEEDGIHATLSFNRSPFATFVPWSAIFLIADFAGRGAVWREDLPPELSHAETEAGPVVHETLRDLAPTPPAPPPPQRHLGVVEADASPPPRASDEDEREPEPPRPRPALRLVK